MEITKKPDPNAIQYGGDHYTKAGRLQHWDMVVALGFGWEYNIAQAAKYLTRVKDQELDSRKAVHFIDKLLAQIAEDKVPRVFQTTTARRKGFDAMTHSHQVNVDEYLAGYFEANQLSPDSDQAHAITALMQSRTVEDLLAARQIMAGIAGL